MTTMDAPTPDESEWLALLRQGRGDESDTRDASDGEGASASTHDQGGASIDNESLIHKLYGPLCAMRHKVRHQKQHNGSYVVGHLAQSLDGRIATTCGVSRWLSGEEDLLHTHRMRAIADAVLVGANTVQHDDPQLTVRLCAGGNPVRVILDPEHRLDGSQRVFRDDSAPTLLLVAADRAGSESKWGHADVIPVPRGKLGCLDPFEIRRMLALRGLSWLFVEGGGITVSRFLAVGALDRLQITVAPVILGSGRPSLVLPEIHDLAHSLRPRTRRFLLGDDTMIECDFDD
jgi:diaminohydroxyphosphoribosylaminopyrimidine deaminase/5-amino-6-(5-phosphoribosylamino)uracil reductase